MLADLVKAGKLPAVADRVSKNPMALKPVHGVGAYGGTLRTIDPSMTTAIINYMYGHSPLLMINDGLKIVGGHCESWETNKDNTEWLLHFRKGLKWSDGTPAGVEDHLFWWNDMVLNGQQGDAPPDYASVAGKLVEVSKVDDFTLKFKFVAPAPHTAIRMANWAKGGNGLRWIVPAAYLKQFHPKYNTTVKDFSVFNQKLAWHLNPECPVLTAWVLEKIEPGTRRVFVRNPYYWAVDTSGNQLPYIDRLEEVKVEDPEAQKLQVMQGNTDFVLYHGFFMGDVSTLKGGEQRGGYEVRYWDSGSGTGTNFQWNIDHPEDKKRALYRSPEFKQAMSLALDRTQIQKVVYFGTGWPTTGTMTVKSFEFNFNDDAKKFYEKARDAYVAYDPAKAKALLDKIGVKDVNNDGWREFADGSKLEVRLDITGTPNKEHAPVIELAIKNWKDIGLNVITNPMASAAFTTMWNGGKGEMRSQWECTGAIEQLSWGAWLVPQEPTRWAPLHGNRRSMIGTTREDTELDKAPWDRNPPRWASTEAGYKDGPVPALDVLFDKGISEVDPVKRYGITQQIIQIHIDKGPFIVGTVANYPRILIVSTKLMNVPTREEMIANGGNGGVVNAWLTPYPGLVFPETFAFKK